jgi:2,5-diamino-6-(ribosylamino)-4(3H)-pyrimidinone 5'-phosphate reductase
MSVDGKIALPTKEPIKLSSLEDFKRVHNLRNYCDGILVGINTVMIDNPKLTVKPEFVIAPRNPIRIVLDSKGRTPTNSYVLDGKAPTIIIIGKKLKKIPNKFKNTELLYCPMINSNELDLKYLLKILKTRGIENLLVEGGETVIFNFLRNHLVDEFNIYINSVVIGGINTPSLAGGKGINDEEDLIRLKLFSFERSGDGLLLKYLVK